VKVFDAGNDWATVYGEKTDDMLSRFHLIPERNGRTDERTRRFAISIPRVSIVTRDKDVKNNQ